MTDAAAGALLAEGLNPNHPSEPAQAPAWHSLPVSACATHLESNLDQGLSILEAGLRLQRFGANQLAAKKPRSLWF